MEALKGWRTLGAAVGVAVLGAVQTYLQADGGALIPLAYTGPVLLAIGFGMAWLRSMTTTPPLESSETKTTTVEVKKSTPGVK